MSKPRELRVEPVAAPHTAATVRSVREAPAREPRPAPGEHDTVAAVAGHGRGAYAEYVVDPETNDLLVRIRDVATDRVLSELPSAEVQTVSRQLREYANALARRRLALRSSIQV